MRFLVDECLPAKLAAALSALGHDAVHVSDLNLLGAFDIDVMAAARRDERVLISADTDFGELLALRARADRSGGWAPAVRPFDEFDGDDEGDREGDLVESVVDEAVGVAA